MTSGEREGEWRADPSGRHDLRWFEVDHFTDDVADAGVVAHDPVPVGPPAWPSAPPTAWAPPGAPAEVPTPGASPPAGRRRRRVLPVLLVLALVAVVGGGGAYWWFEVRGPRTGAGTFAGELTDAAPLGAHRIFVPAGSVALVTVDPDEDLDAVVGFVPDLGADAVAVEDLYDGTGFAAVAEAVSARTAFDVDGSDLEDAGVVGDRVVFLIDVGFEGQPERTFLLLGTDVPADVVVAGFEGSVGEYEVTVELVDLGIEAEDLARLRGRRALDLVRRDEAVPEPFRTLVDETR